MEFDGRRVLTCRDLPSQRLGHCADVVRASAAADSDVVDAQRLRLARVVGHLEPRTEKGLERDWKDVGPVGGFQGLERRHRLLRFVGNRLSRDVAAHRPANLLDDREHGRGPSIAVQPDDVGPVVRQDLAGIDVAIAIPGLVRSGGGQRDHGRQAQFLDDLQRDQRLAQIIVGLRDDEIDALVNRPGELLLVHRADHPGRCLLVLRVVCPGVADVTGDQGIAFARNLVGDLDCLAVHCLEVVLAADVLELGAMRVVGERHHDVSARPEELAMQLS